MIELLEFIFQSFWHWLGSFLLIGAVGRVFSGLITINRNKAVIKKNSNNSEDDE